MELDAIVTHGFNMLSRDNVGVDENLNGRGFKNSCLDSSFNVFAAATVDHDRVDAGALEEVCKLESCGASAQNAYLGANSCGHL